MPVVSAIDGLKVALFVFAVLGTIRLVALSYPNKPISQAFLLIY